MALLLPMLPLAAAEFDDPNDYQTTLDLGVRSPGNTVTAPFNVTADFSGLTFLNVIEINATNAVPIDVSVYLTSQYSPIAPDNSTALLEAWGVTFFRLEFRTLALVTSPASNHTASAKIASNFAGMNPAPPDQAYMVVLENKALDSAHVVYRQDRASTLSEGPLAGTLALVVVAIAGVGAVCAIGYLVLKRRSRPQKPEPPRPGP